MEQVERIERTYIRKCHSFDLYDDTMKLPDGRTSHWDFLQHIGAAAVVPVTEDGKILLVRQFRNAINRRSLEIPAGKKDFEEESGLECAKRELREETGFVSDHLEPLTKLITAIAFCDEVIEVFVARDLKKAEQDLDEDEFIDVVAFRPEELREMIFDGSIQDAKTVAAVMAYTVKYGGKDNDKD